MYRTYRSKQRSKQHLCVSFSEAYNDCKCWESAGGANVGACVGTAGNIGEQASTASGLSKVHDNGDGRGANLGAIVGPAAIGDVRGNCNVLSNGTRGSNSSSFSDGDFPKLVASKFYVHKEPSKKVIAHLSDHDQLVETFQELRQLFPLQMQAQRRRKRDLQIHESSIDTSMNMREHICVGTEVDKRQMLKKMSTYH
jgi:hypothetical protein